MRPAVQPRFPGQRSGDNHDGARPLPRAHNKEQSPHARSERIAAPGPPAARTPSRVLPQRRRGGARSLHPDHVRRHGRGLRPAGEDPRSGHRVLVPRPGAAARRAAAGHAGGGRRHGDGPGHAADPEDHGRAAPADRGGPEPRNDEAGPFRPAGRMPARTCRGNSGGERHRRFRGDGLCTAPHRGLRGGGGGIPARAQARRPPAGAGDHAAAGTLLRIPAEDLYAGHGADDRASGVALAQHADAVALLLGHDRGLRAAAAGDAHAARGRPRARRAARRTGHLFRVHRAGCRSRGKERWE